MPLPTPLPPQEFAIQIVRRLRDAGHQALWAGGCVRDQLLGLAPKDYDVATDANPNRIRELFGHRRTRAVGAAFGVIAVIGPKSAGTVEVATFREDAQYSDGRHPDRVVFSTPEQDAQRRDFTINGLFFDPLTEQVIDYVGGQADLRAGIVRAIGNPERRIDEDKLRMLRAIRFATTFQFELDPATFAAIQQHAHELVIVSAERVAEELRKMLTASTRAAAVRLLQASKLLPVALPECERLQPPFEEPSAGALTIWERTLAVLEALRQTTFSVALAALFRELQSDDPHVVRTAGQRLRLSNHELEGAEWLIAHESVLRQASRIAWPRLQRLLVGPRRDELLELATAVAQVVDGTTQELDYCRHKLELPPNELNPPPLIDGHDLRQAGFAPGPAFRAILEAIRDAQLDRCITDRDEALQLARQLAGDVER